MLRIYIFIVLLSSLLAVSYSTQALSMTDLPENITHPGINVSSPPKLKAKELMVLQEETKIQQREEAKRKSKEAQERKEKNEASRREREIAFAETDRQKHIQLQQKAKAEQEHTVACFRLAQCYAAPLWVEQDHNEAFRLYSIAAKENYPPALYSLGLCYGKGTGVERDMAKGASLQREAIKAGYIMSW